MLTELNDVTHGKKLPAYLFIFTQLRFRSPLWHRTDCVRESRECVYEYECVNNKNHTFFLHLFRYQHFFRPDSRNKYHIIWYFVCILTTHLVEKYTSIELPLVNGHFPSIVYNVTQSFEIVSKFVITTIRTVVELKRLVGIHSNRTEVVHIHSTFYENVFE